MKISNSLFKVFLGLNYFSQDEYNAISKIYTEEKRSPVELLYEKGIVFETIKDVLSKNYAIDYCDLSNFENTDNIVSVLSHDIARKYSVLPIKLKGNNLYLAMENPLDINNIDNISLITGYDIIPLLAEQSELSNLISLYYMTDSINFIESQFLSTDLKTENNLKKISYKEEFRNSPTVKIIDSLLESALFLKASDIHIEPFKDIVRIRYRIDGILNEFENLDITIHANLISRLKIMANLGDVAK